MRNLRTENCIKRAASVLFLSLFTFVGVWADVKWVKRDVSKLQTGDVVVIVESNNAVALTNNPGNDKNPEAASVKLNDDLNRITSEVPDTLKWRVTVAEGPKYRFERVDSAGRYLNVTDGNLRVGEVTARYSFDHTGSLLHIGVGSNDYYIGVKVTDQMISKNYEWNTKTDASDADIKESKIEFFVMSEKPDITLAFPYRNYEADYNGGAGTFAEPALTVDPSKSVSFSSSDDKIASVGSDGKVTLKKRGNVKIFASFDGDETYNEYDTYYILRIDDTPKKGSRTNPFTPQEVNDLLAGNIGDVDGVSLQKGCSYFVKGIVSKVSSGMMDMMGGMMGDMDFEDMMDGYSIPAMSMMGGSVNYYISADGTTDGQIKVLNPNGQPGTYDNAVILYPMDEDALGVGDVVTVYGPLIYTEDNDMMSSIGGSGDNNQKYTSKVDEVNYIKDGSIFARMTATSLNVMQENTTKSPSDFYEINTDTHDGIPFTGTVQPATMKSSNEEVAKWVYTDEQKTDSVFTALKAGTTKLTIKVKVILEEDDPSTTDTNEEKSYTMKEKIRLTVTTRNLTPAGQNVGTFRLVTDATKLEEGDSLLLVVPAEDGNVQVLGTDKAMMGGISPVDASLMEVNGENVLVDVPLDGQVVRLATVAGEDGYWYLKTGDMSYLSATSDSGSGGMGAMGGSSGLKSGISEQTPGDTCKATISISSEGLATIRFKAPEGDDKKNIIKFGASSMSFGGGGSGEGSGSSMPDMGAMMGSVFNTYESTDTKAALPKLYRFVQNNEYSITIGETKWATLVSAYDAVLPEEFTAYVVTDISEGKAQMTPVPSSYGIKAGLPYVIKGPDVQGTYYLTRANTPSQEPERNLLAISDSETTSGVYVLAKRNGVAGFYKWNGGLLGTGRVYLPMNASSPSPSVLNFDFVDDDNDPTAINSVQYIMVNDAWYDLSGRRVNGQLPKGIYIHNGKKVIIK